VADDQNSIQLSDAELREVARYAAACARPGLVIFESERAEDERPRAAIESAEAFASGGKRSKRLRDCAWAALRAAHDTSDAGLPAASEAARAALAAAGAAFLHPLPRASQVKHILGAAAHTARALGLNAKEGAAAAEGKHIKHAMVLASPMLVRVLKRYPPAPAGGGPVGELIRRLDASLRAG
jgi:hypothetical protein